MSSLDFNIKESIPNKRGDGLHYFHVVFRPTKDDLRILGGHGVHSNIFLSQQPKGIEAAVEAYWERKLKAADIGKPYPQQHMKTTLNLCVIANADDAAERDDSTGFTSTGLTVAMLSSNNAAIRTNAGLRFQAVTIAQGQLILAAVTRVFSVGTAFDDPDIYIYGEDIDNSPNFVTNADVTSRVLTTANTQWFASGVGTGYKTSPDFTAVVQEVINRVSWASGNALTIILKPRITGGPFGQGFEIALFDNSIDPEPCLDIDFSSVTTKAALAYNPITDTLYILDAGATPPLYKVESAGIVSAIAWNPVPITPNPTITTPANGQNMVVIVN